jgi:hypothetical protein
VRDHAVGELLHVVLLLLHRQRRRTAVSLPSTARQQVVIYITKGSKDKSQRKAKGAAAQVASLVNIHIHTYIYIYIYIWWGQDDAGARDKVGKG